MEVRRQLCFTIVPFSLSNPKTIANLFTTHSSELTALMQTVFEIEGRNRIIMHRTNTTWNELEMMSRLSLSMYYD